MKKKKKLEEEGARGDITSPQRLATLIKLLTEVNNSRRQGVGIDKEIDVRTYPARCRDYPQYESIRSIGEKINHDYGYDALTLNHSLITSEDPQLGELLALFWDGIGGWSVY